MTKLKLVALALLLVFFAGGKAEAATPCIKHTFVSSAADSGDATKVGPAEWNECHTIDDGAISEGKLDFDPATQTELDAHINDAAAAHNATAIEFTPSGDIIGATVDAAIQELDAEKVPIAGSAIHTDFSADDHTGYALITTSAGAPAADACVNERHIIVDTTNDEIYHCPNGAASQPLTMHSKSAAYNLIQSNSGSAAPAAGGSTLNIVGTANISCTAADGAPDSVTCKMALASQAQGDIIYYNGTDWVRLPPGTSGQFLKTNGAAANPEWAAASGGSSPSVPMRMMTIQVGAANAFVDTIDGTNFDYSGVRYLDAVTGKSNWTANIATAPTNLVLKHKAISGAGGNVSLGIYCVSKADNEAYDDTVTYIKGASGNPDESVVNTSANLTRTAISLSGLTMAAGDEITCGIDRVGGDALDTLGVDWLLIGVSLE